MTSIFLWAHEFLHGVCSVQLIKVSRYLSLSTDAGMYNQVPLSLALMQTEIYLNSSTYPITIGM